ncbi:MAG TPA: hypothetical protein VH092_10595 [Urbifossiella sp.]|nr:hypothetical protein [Urbifossiella sp.]
MPVAVKITAGGAGGATTFTFGQSDGERPPGVTSAAMELHGPFKTTLASTLPHEVMHVVLATHFGRPVPRWADEGIAVLAESDVEQTNHEVRARELLNAGRGIRLATLFRMTDYPRDMIVMFVQGHSVCRFLLDRGPPADGGPTRSVRYPAGPASERVTTFPSDDRYAALLAFVGIGSWANTPESWAAAAKGVYGFDSIDALEQAWIDSLREPPGRRRPVAPPPREPGEGPRQP